jgi:hypothetical protein
MLSHAGCGPKLSLDPPADQMALQDCIGRVSLGKDDLALAVLTNAPPLANLGEKRFRIE